MSQPRPILAIVGRPNVGKSSLFNRLVGRRHALVRDVPGVTRDRLYGRVEFERWQATVIDTGGFDPSSEEPLIEGVRHQVLLAVEEADLILFLVDAREGATALDIEIAGILRRAGRPIVLVANKVDTGEQESALGDLYRLGFGEPLPVSAEHGRGVAEMLEKLREVISPRAGGVPASSGPSPRTADSLIGSPRDSRDESMSSPRAGGPSPDRPAVRTAARSGRSAPTAIAVVGRPNVGKSSLVNAMVGAERVLVHSEPGTTRDAVDTPFTRDGRPYVLVDTAGIRRKGRVNAPLEKLAVVMALKSLERSQVAIVVVDASEGLTAQDAHIAGYAHEAGRATVIAVNKWDLVPPGLVRKADVVNQVRDRLPFLEYAPICFTSAISGDGLEDLFRSIDEVAAAARRRVPAQEVTSVLQKALARRPVSIAGTPLTLQSAAQVGIEPPTFALHVNRPADVHFSYERYLQKSLRHAFGFGGSPLRLSFRKAVGPRVRRSGARR